MSHVGAPRGRTCSRTFRSVALLTTGVLALPALSACSSDDNGSDAPAAAVDVAPASRAAVSQGGTLHWAIDSMPATLNAFQADADAATNRIAGAVLPTLFTLDKRGRPQLNPDYLESAKIVDREPKQVVSYKLNQQAVWSDGREIGAPDFVAQWHALRGQDSAYWTARNAGYERIEKIERGGDDLEVRVTFNKPYADWKSLFSPLYPKEVMGTPNAFNDGARTALKKTAGPFTVKKVDRKAKEATLVRDPHWWGKPAKLDSVVLSAVPNNERVAALASGKLDVADVDPAAAKRISSAVQDKNRANGPARPAAGAGPATSAGPAVSGSPAAGPAAVRPPAQVSPASALRAWALTHGADKEELKAAGKSRKQTLAAIKEYTEQQRELGAFRVRKSLEPSFTQLALNGESGPLADDRVRRAVARAINRQTLANAVLKPLGLPAQPLGSHLALRGQQAYADSSDALGKQNTHEAQALLADAGWTVGGARKAPDDGTKAGSEGKKDAEKTAKKDAEKTEKKDTEKKDTEKKDAEKKAEKPKTEEKSDDTAEGDDKPGQAPDDSDTKQQAVKAAQDTKPGGVAGAYAPSGTAAPSTAASSGAKGPKAAKAAKVPQIGKDGKPLTLRFVLPSGQGSEQLRTVGERIARMLDKVGISTQITKVSDASYFKDYIASGDYDMALYSWPATAFPATDGRPIYAKPEPASDGSLLVEQNYTRVGTDRIDQLFDQASGELNEGDARDLVKQADARIWAAAGSIPLYQRPQLVAARSGLKNIGAYGFATPRYQDIGFAGSHGHDGPQAEVSKKK